MNPACALPILLRPFVVLTVALLLLGAASCDHAGHGKLVYESGTEKGKKIRLPDGTDVMMDPGTVIRLDPEFNKGNRVLEFGGKAEFDVAADPARPFVIHTKDLQILVLGTRFWVDAYPDKAGEEVDCLSGRLKVMKSYHSSTDNQPEMLEAGEMVMINREVDLMEKEKLSAAELKAIEMR